MAHTDITRSTVDEPIRLFRAAGPIQPLSDALGRRIATVAATLLGLVVACGVAFSHIPPGVGFGPWARAPEPTVAGVPAAVLKTKPAEKRHSILSTRLAAAAVVYPQTFSSIVTSPSSLCEAFVQDGLPMGPWQRSLAAQDGGECSMLIGPDGHSLEDGIDGGSLFVMVREGSKGRVGAFRMKLNLLDAGDNAALLTQATRILATLSRFADVALPAGVEDAVANRRPVEVVSDFGSVRFGHEWQDEQRYNLSVRYARQPTLKAPAPHGT